MRAVRAALAARLARGLPLLPDFELPDLVLFLACAVVALGLADKSPAAASAPAMGGNAISRASAPAIHFDGPFGRVEESVTRMYSL